jgi:hypothetical protein
MVDVRTNLLKNRQTLSEKDYQKEKNLLRLGVVGLVVVVVVVVAMSIWNLVLTSKMSRIDREFGATSKEMQGLVQASAQQVYLKSRLKLITGFLAERSTTRESLQKVFSTDIAGTHIASVSFEGESGLGLQYVADSTAPLKELLAYYEADTGYYTQAVSNGLSRSNNGTYQITIFLTLPKGDK